MARQYDLNNTLYRRPYNIWIDDRIKFISYKSIATPLFQRIVKKQSRHKEKQRHMETVYDAVQNNQSIVSPRDPGLFYASEHMTEDDQNDSHALGIIHPGIISS
ncbi:hypothetical protein AA12717_3770 [Gluconacetobacter sacchari DSM 12717]|uniref:Uncharacterized protein n=1 Tax=Gluconacetobacter sacchari DSM 12717 TaxID=1307940 RepID=A0ABQ0PCH8_9PROT|nr:hypothetical protein AA12717_3770 [Gluconacetobacter sacchari DSM 12717]